MREDKICRAFTPEEVAEAKAIIAANQENRRQRERDAGCLHFSRVQKSTYQGALKREDEGDADEIDFLRDRERVLVKRLQEHQSVISLLQGLAIELRSVDENFTESVRAGHKIESILALLEK